MVSIRIVIASTVPFLTAAARAANATPKKPIFAPRKISDISTAPVKPEQPPKWLEICGQLAPATSILCSLAPLPTILEASRAKSVGSLPLLPYSSMAANGLVWALYGWLTDSDPVKYANIMGTLLGAYYFREFKKYSPAGSSNLPGTINQHLIVVAWVVFVNGFVLSNFPKHRAAEIVGKEGVLMYIILFASPLAAVKNVIATKSAESIPLPFTIASTINCSLWSLAGYFLMRDFNIYFPSMMGLLCALAQLFLKGVYVGDGDVMDAGVLEEMSKMDVHRV
mmetsp:Transcript_8573/g.14880  ORF Transcript_8573/g.14880 Transcript_8573/m.14880 type:complete len:281 (+) Transcript_8573:88-930(+)